MKAILIPLSCILLLTACDKKEDTQQTNNNPGSTTTSFSGTMHDTAFTADYFQNAYPGPLLQLYANETSSNRSVTLTLDTKDMGTHTMTTVLNGTSASCQAGGGLGFYSIHGSGHGSITISASSANSVSGTFSFTGYNFAGTDSVIVSGQFNNMTF